MKVVLARPPRRDPRDAGLPVPPLGLAYLAGVSQRAARPVQVIDAYALGWSWARFEQELRTIRPDVLGLGTMTPVADVAYRAARIGRGVSTHIILGGPHPTAIGEGVFSECAEIDHLAIGEAEETWLPYLDWVAAGATGAPPAGIRARDQPFKAHSPSQDIESIPWPARDLLPQQAYRYLMATRPGFATMVTSRGCPFSCSFCDKSVSGSKWRARGAQSVVDELQALQEMGVGFVNFYDDNFTLHRRRVVEICEEILRRGLDIEWKCEGRVDGVDLPMLQLMRRAGCRVVAFGVESGNAETLALLRKDVKVTQVQAAFEACRKAGLRSLAYIILGAPGENAEQVTHTLRFVDQIGADYVQFSSLVALPGTPLFAEYGHRAPADVQNPVDGDAQRHTVTDLPPEELARLMRQAWRGFYLRPKPLLRLSADAYRSGAWREALRLGGAMARWSLPWEEPAGSPYQPSRAQGGL